MTTINPTADRQDVIALIPAYNEGDHIIDVIQYARQFLPVFVIDDGSTDQTLQNALNSGVEVFEQKPNQGKGAALKRGFKIAIDKGVAGVITLDADGQHDPMEIPRFLDAFDQTKADLIIGERNFRLMPPLRKISNTIGQRLFSWAVRQPIRDNQSGYRFISSRLMTTMLQSPEEGFELEVEMIVVCVNEKMNIFGVPIRTIYGDEHSHIRPLKHAWNFMRMVWQTRRRTQPNQK